MLDETINEEWATILEFPNYMISTFGRVFNAKFKRFFKPAFNSTGYKIVSLCGNGKCLTKTIHRLVAEAFIPFRDGAFDVNHIDGDRANNYVWNLEWCTQSENIQHAYNIGQKFPPHPRAIRIIEIGEEFQSITACAKHINAFRENVRHCLSGKRKRAGGFSFEYVE